MHLELELAAFLLAAVEAAQLGCLAVEGVHTPETGTVRINGSYRTNKTHSHQNNTARRAGSRGRSYT